MCCVLFYYQATTPAVQAADAAHHLAKPSSSEAAALIAKHMKYIPLQESSQCKLSQVAAAKCIQLSNLSHNKAKELGKLFPSCADIKRSQPSFDPHQEFHGTPFILKRKVRNNLKKQGRICIQDILLTTDQ